MKKKPIYKALSFFLSLCLIAATITVPAFAVATLTIDPIEDVTVAVGDSVNIPLSATMGDAAEGMTNLAFSIDGGSLPSGLSLNGNKIIGTADTATVRTQITIGATADDGAAESGVTASGEVFNITVVALDYTWNPTTTINAITGKEITGTVGGAITNSGDNTRKVTYDSEDKPVWLTINPNTGALSGTPVKGTFNFGVTATLTGDAAGTTRQFTLEVADPEIQWTPLTTTLDSGVVGVNYTSVNIANGASTNGTGSVTFESKNLPGGLGLSEAGVLSGIPTAAVNNGTFDVNASAPGATARTETFTITIAERNVTLDSISAQTATVGTAFTLTPKANTNTGETIAYAISVTKGGQSSSLPTDLSFEPTTGVITGTITTDNGVAAEGEYNVTITASVDQGAVFDSKTFKLTVSYPRVELQPITNVDNAIATKAITDIDVSTGIVNTTNAQVTYSMSGHPTGLRIDTTSGVISGTPAMADLNQGAAKTHTVQVTATAGGKSDSVTFDITVNPPAFVDVPASIGSQEIMEGKAIASVNVAQLFAGKYTGGDSVAYSVASVEGPNGGTALPNNVKFESNTLSGTAAQGTKGTYTITFKAEGQTSGIETTATYTLTVGERKFTTSTLENDTLKLGAEYSKDVKTAFVYNDPDAAVTYETTTSLPTGLALDKNTGVISGKITDKNLVSDAPVQITVKAKDAANQFDSDPVTFNLTIQGLSFTAFNVPAELTAYQGYSFTNSDISAVFEEAGVALEFSAQNLAPNLSINAQTGEITGTINSSAQEGTDTVEITVTDQTYGYTASKDISFTVKTPSITITKPENVTIYEGYDFNQVIAEATVDVPEPGHITYSVTGLPNAIMFDSGTRTIRGAADAGTAQATPYTVTIEVGDGITTATQTFDMTVKAPVLTVDAIQNVELYAGNSADINIGWTYEGPKTASATVTGLPEGLTYANGKITGTVTAAAVKADPYMVDVEVTDGTNTDKRSFTITVKAKTEVPPTQKPEELEWDGNTEGATGMEIRFDVPFEQFTGQVYFNGKLLRKDVDYTAKSGSTIITLTNSFLKSLTTASYDVEAVFTGSIGKASVNVVAATPTTTPTTTTTGTTTTGTTTTNTTTNTTSSNITDVTVTDPNKPGTDVGGGQTTSESTTPAAGTTTTVAKSDEGDSPKTGDNNALVILIVLTILAGGATMVLYKKRKKA